MNDDNDQVEEELVVAAAATAVMGAALSVLNYYKTYYDKTPYHDSAFTGAAWVSELLAGHPKRIRQELGVQKHVFQALITALKDAGYKPSKFVTLEEQLAIFLYTCVTGLSLRHVCERFQRSMDTTSKCVLLFLRFDCRSKLLQIFPPDVVILFLVPILQRLCQTTTCRCACTT
jgi:hypothetical protein